MTASAIPRRDHSCGTGGHALDLAGEPEVPAGDAALVVRREPDAHLAPPDVEVRMVVGLLGQEAHPGHEGDGVRERRQLVGLLDLVVPPLPAGQIGRARR